MLALFTRPPLRPHPNPHPQTHARQRAQPARLTRPDVTTNKEPRSLSLFGQRYPRPTSGQSQQVTTTPVLTCMREERKEARRTIPRLGVQFRCVPGPDVYFAIYQRTQVPIYRLAPAMSCHAMPCHDKPADISRRILYPTLAYAGPALDQQHRDSKRTACGSRRGSRGRGRKPV